MAPWDDETVTLTIGLSPLDTARCDLVLDLPAHGPVTHGMLRLEAEIDGDVIISARPVLGGMHRGAEKLFESRDYRQVISLANRHEWLASFAGELGATLVVERAMGIEAPEHAAWLRTLLLEYHRVTSHLAFLSGHPGLPAIGARELREQWLAVLQQFTGTRMHSMVSVIGGLAREPGAEWLETVTALAAASREVVGAMLDAAKALPAGLGRVDREAVTALAVSGPVARAAGVSLDARRAESALRYAELTPPALVGGDGDSRSRMAQLAREILDALSTIEEAAARCVDLCGSPVNVLLPKVVRVPVGEYSGRLETPTGIAQWLLVSRGDKSPHRLALRPASLHTVLALEVALRGAHIGDAAGIVASMPFVTGDAER